MSDDRELVERLRETETVLRWDTDEIPMADLLAEAAAAIERLMAERDALKHDVERHIAIAGEWYASCSAAEMENTGLKVRLDEALLQATYETDVAAAEIEGRKAAEARVTLLEGSLRKAAERLEARGHHFGAERARAALTALPQSPQSASPPDDGEATS